METVFTAADIQAAVARLAREIERDYRDKNPILLGVLKGCFVFMADLVRALNMPVEIEFISLSSYGPRRTQSTGRIEVVQGLRKPVRARHVLVVEDIIDTGVTLDFTLHYLRRRRPASVRVCALFDKTSRRKVPVSADYVGLTVPDCFLVGYGLDFDERFRHLPGLYCLKEDD
ncbi:MAG: hypoxanthine phosphoribosyltransferase [Dehalococcoidia bacterium]|nr:hypoxanthine phosphoribosyltransferase [Dehalococcoidia bacterium]